MTKKMCYFSVKLMSVVWMFFASMHIASACSCIKPELSANVAREYDVIFMGTTQPIGHVREGSSAISITFDDKRFIRFDVVQAWTGLDDAVHVVTVETPGTSSLCGYSFKPDTEYIIYANYVRDNNGVVLKDGEGNNVIRVTSCSHTKENTKEVQVETALLDEIFSVGDLDKQKDNDDDFFFVAVPRTVASGEKVVLAWDVPDAKWCFASDGWHGLRKKSGRRVIKDIDDNHASFSLRCFYGALQSQKRTIKVDVFGKKVVCPDDVRICANGTVIGRSGKKCEFACPDLKSMKNDVCQRDVESNDPLFVQPIDPFRNNRSLAYVNCADNQTLFRVFIGSEPHDQRYYIWHRAYYTVDGKTFTEENSVRLHGPRDASGKWVVGAAHADVPREHMKGSMQYLAYYMCIYEDGVWKCGCSQDGACSDTQNDEYRWTIVGLNNSIEYEEKKENEEKLTIPKSCVTWFDGCNTCNVEKGKITMCTKRACRESEKRAQKCLAFARENGVCTDEYEPVCGKTTQCLCDESDTRCLAPCKSEAKTFSNRCMAKKAGANILYEGKCKKDEYKKKGRNTGKECRPTGCSGQICADKEIVSTCEWRAEYACYRDAVCERQPDGQCGWTQTAGLKACISSAREKRGTEAVIW